MPIKEAATHFGVKEVAIRNSIMRGSKKYTHRKKKGVGGRGEVYEIEIEVKDEALDAAKSVESQRKAIARYKSAPESKQKDAELRLRLIRRYNERGNLTIEEFLESLHPAYARLKVTKPKIYRWKKIVQDADESGACALDGLLDTRGTNKPATVMTDEIKKHIVTMILEKPHRKTRNIHKFLKGSYGEATPDYTTVARYVQWWKENNALVYELADNPDKATGKYRPAAGSADGNIEERNQLWELDSTPADIICSDGKRRILSAAIDVYSRRVTVVLEERSNFLAHARMFKKGIRKLGVPDQLRIDNGKDYLSKQMGHVVERLKMKPPIQTEPFSGYQKPFIERFFRRISHDLFEELDGYIGHSVSDRQAIISRQTFPNKLESIRKWRQKQKDGDEFASRFALKKENRGMEVEVPLSADELQQWIDKWVVVYEHSYHSTLKMTPMQKWDSCMEAVKKGPGDDRVLDVLLGLSMERTIRKKGISFFAETHYWHNDMWDMVGDRVQVLSDDDMGHIYVFDLDYHYLFTAENPEYLGKSRKEYIAAARKWDKQKRKIIKMIEDIRSDAPQRMQEHLERELERIEGDPKVAIEVGYAHKSDIVDAIADAIEASEPESMKGVRQEDGTLPVINGRPMFKSLYQRFMWCLERDEWNEDDIRLRGENPDEYAAANKNHKILKGA